eukprot:TRINITY_DN2481_c0_g1_i2.p1 TRINITY_DN2481_c0_g1~~TRINITY_DN2481_c0_g1_i2.p1  ORF type:complete len:208 (-),score=-9.40 TRINITY_DN2481_c0_g1_i2:517-1062(-)
MLIKRNQLFYVDQLTFFEQIYPKINWNIRLHFYVWQLLNWLKLQCIVSSQINLLYCGEQRQVIIRDGYESLQIQGCDFFVYWQVHFIFVQIIRHLFRRHLSFKTQIFTTRYKESRIQFVPSMLASIFYGFVSICECLKCNIIQKFRTTTLQELSRCVLHLFRRRFLNLLWTVSNIMVLQNG